MVCIACTISLVRLPDLVETLLFEVMMNGYGDQACDTLHISSTVKKHAFLCVHVYTVHMIDARCYQLK